MCARLIRTEDAGLSSAPEPSTDGYPSVAAALLGRKARTLGCHAPVWRRYRPSDGQPIRQKVMLGEVRLLQTEAR